MLLSLWRSLRTRAHILRDPTAEQVKQATDLVTRHRPSIALTSTSREKPTREQR